MKFLYEKQTRRFYIFLAVLCVLQIFLLGVCGAVQTWGIRRVLVERELAAVSYLLEEGVPPAVAASAWNHTKVTEEGEELLEKIKKKKDKTIHILQFAKIALYSDSEAMG